MTKIRTTLDASSNDSALGMIASPGRITECTPLDESLVTYATARIAKCKSTELAHSISGCLPLANYLRFCCFSGRYLRVTSPSVAGNGVAQDVQAARDPESGAQFSELIIM